MSGIRILAIVVAAVVYFFIGAIWYGQFSVAWLAGSTVKTWSYLFLK